MYYSTLSGTLIACDPSLNISVRTDGAVRKSDGTLKNVWTYGSDSISSGYMNFSVRKKLYRVHRLVATCFLPNPYKKPFVDHINHNRTDNRVCNLRWVTPKENGENQSKKWSWLYEMENAEKVLENRPAITDAMVDEE